MPGAGRAPLVGENQVADDGQGSEREKHPGRKGRQDSVLADRLPEHTHDSQTVGAAFLIKSGLTGRTPPGRAPTPQ